MATMVKTVCVLILMTWCQVTAITKSRQLIERLTSNYDTATPPGDGESPTEVKLGIYVNSLSAIDAKNMQYSLNMYLRTQWTDARLEFDSTEVGKSKVRLEPSKDKIWLPDVFFRNAKEVKHHQVPTDGTYLRINDSGSVWFVRQLSGTFTCPMVLNKFPFDIQSCPVMFESFGYTMDVLTLNWLRNPVDLDPSVQVPDFSVHEFTLYNCSQTYTAGSFPCLEVRFWLKRDLGYYILQLYLPSILTVAVSWLGFWLHSNAIAARAVVGFITLLILTMQSGWARASLPPVSYVTALDIWAIVCFVFIVLSLLELAAVSVMARRQGGKGKKETDEEDQTSSKIDVVCRIAFPLVFLFFMIVYFAVYAA